MVLEFCEALDVPLFASGGSQNIKVVTRLMWSLGRVDEGSHISQLRFSIESTSLTHKADNVSGVNHM